VLPTLPFDRPAVALEQMAEIVRRTIGGTSGPLNAALLVGAAGAIRLTQTVDAPTWAAALAAGTQAIGHIGGAHRGDRTMLDGLIPAAEILTAGGTLTAAAAAAMAGAESTADTAAAVGRSSYLGDRVLGHPDPGAWAVGLWLQAAADALDSVR
jgi:dihydroxyacetone kinase